MSYDVEIARIAFEEAQDRETVTVAEILPWLRNRKDTAAVAMVERAAAAVGRAKRLRAEIASRTDTK